MLDERSQIAADLNDADRYVRMGLTADAEECVRLAHASLLKLAANDHSATARLRAVAVEPSSGSITRLRSIARDLGVPR